MAHPDPTTSPSDDAPDTDDTGDTAREPARDGAADGPGAGRPVRTEALLALEVCGLVGLGFTRPILDSFGRAPEVFLAHGAGRFDVVLFALGIALVPVVAIAAVGALTRLGGARVRLLAHVVIVGALGAVVVARFGTDLWSPAAGVLAVVAIVAGVGLALLRLRSASTATYLRLLGAASAIFVVQFLVFSPTADIATSDGGEAVDVEASAAVEAATGGEPPPIVVVVLDALPTSSLLDGDGHVDADLYPNIAAFTDEATWYRNNSTTSALTYQAVPAMLSGLLPTSDLPDTATYPDNLFTLFAGSHDITAVEQITRLCPEEACERDDDDALGSLYGAAIDWWRAGIEPETGAGGGDEGAGARLLPGVLEPDRGDDFADWVDDQDFSEGDRPGLWFYHLVLPHEPWELLSDGARYADLSEGEEQPTDMWLSIWGGYGAEVGLQRQVLQTMDVDRLLGHLFDELRAAGTYDDSLIVVAGDHGQAFTPRGGLRGVYESQFEQVAWTPLMIKAPGQEEGVVDDADVWNIDLVPTLADMLGVELDWDLDGVPAGRAAEERTDGAKLLAEGNAHQLDPDGDTGFIPLDAATGFDRVLAADPVSGTGDDAVWRRTAHGALVGAAVDDLRVGSATGGTLAVDQLGRIEEPGDEPPLLELLGRLDPTSGDAVAVAVNGEVAAVAPVVSGEVASIAPAAAGDGDVGPVVHALLRPDAFGPDNEVTAYVVTGSPGAETLHPLEVTAG